MKAKTSSFGGAPDDKITGLVQTLHATQSKLQRLTGGEVDAVMHPGGHAYLLHKAQEKLRKCEAAQRQTAETQLAIPRNELFHVDQADEAWFRLLLSSHPSLTLHPHAAFNPLATFSAAC